MKKLKNILSTFFIFVLLTINIQAQDLTFTFANPQITNNGTDDFFEVDVQISGTTDFKLGSGQIYLNYNSAAFGANVSANNNIEYTYPTGYILGQVAGFPIYGSFVDNDNTTDRVSFAWQQAVALGGFSENVTATPANLFHVKIKFLDASQAPNLCFESNAPFDNQTYTACGPNNFALADCANFPGTQLFNDTYDCSAALLPVELLFFRGKSQNQAVLLEWETATEINNSHFIVERMTNGRNFTPIGKVVGAGSSSIPTPYTFWDKSPTLGNNYYRLRQVDFDGTFTYTKTILIHFADKNQDDYILFPNPTTDYLGVTSKIFALQNYRIYDALGRIVKVQQNLVGDDFHLINVADLPSGMYYLQINDSFDYRSFIKK